MSTFIAIDGLDGSGKNTQSDLLVSRLKIEGYAVRSISFPMYESESSTLVKMYLDGKLDTIPELEEEILPFHEEGHSAYYHRYHKISTANVL